MNSIIKKRLPNFLSGFLIGIMIAVAVVGVRQRLRKSAMNSTVADFQSNLPNLRPAELVRLRAAQEAPLEISVPAGWALVAEAPNWLTLFAAQGGAHALARAYSPAELQAGSLRLPVLQENKTYRLQGSFFYCEKKNPKVCRMQSHDQSLSASATGDFALTILLADKD